MLNAAYQYMDVAPQGRNEDDKGPMWWLRRHDEYQD
jgi:predicted dithiol-disulfide oxidoreductase (DUF899 family)